MDLLLDTHIFLWYIGADSKLSVASRDRIRDVENKVFLSSVSLWEALVKHRLGKLPLPEDPEIYLPKQRVLHHIDSLPLDEASVQRLVSLPSLHRDPFDRMLICQAMEYGLTLLTVDGAIKAYPIDTL
jgi:PIN domain nuclease of toxin-antitoxin system